MSLDIYLRPFGAIFQTCFAEFREKAIVAVASSWQVGENASCVWRTSHQLSFRITSNVA